MQSTLQSKKCPPGYVSFHAYEQVGIPSNSLKTGSPNFYLTKSYTVKRKTTQHTFFCWTSSSKDIHIMTVVSACLKRLQPSFKGAQNDETFGKKNRSQALNIWQITLGM